MSITVRLFFEKQDRCKYISHLDITRCFARAVARTDIPVWYTEGFNPRIYMTFALPIPLGFESNCESLDMRLTDDSFLLDRVTEELNQVLPQGIRILQTELPKDKPDTIAQADYTIAMDTMRGLTLKKDFEAFAAQPSIMIMRRTKKGEKEVDLVPLFSIISLEPQEDSLIMNLRLAAGTTVNLNPILLIEAFSAYIGCSIEDYRVTRTAIRQEDLTVWR